MKRFLFALLLLLPFVSNAQTIPLTVSFRGNTPVNSKDTIAYSYPGKIGGYSWLYNAEYIRTNFAPITGGIYKLKNDSTGSGGYTTRDRFDNVIGAATLARINTKQNAITTGSTAQYFRGDLSLATLNTANVPELTNLYYTNARGIGSVLTGYVSGAGTLSAADNIREAIQKLNGNIAGLSTSYIAIGTGVQTSASFNIDGTGIVTNNNITSSASIANGVQLVNNTPSTVGVTQYSPALYFAGYNSSVQKIEMRQYIGANSNNYFTWDYRFGGTGSYTGLMTLSPSGLQTAVVSVTTANATQVNTGNLVASSQIFSAVYSPISGFNNVITFAGSQQNVASNLYTFNGGITTSSSGLSNAIRLLTPYNQSGTASSLDFLINRTETSLGSGTHFFAKFQVGGADKFSVDRLGNTTANSFIKTGGTSSQFLMADGSVNTSGFIDLTSNQTGLTGDKTTTGVWKFGKVGINGSTPTGSVYLSVAGDIAAAGAVGGTIISSTAINAYSTGGGLPLVYNQASKQFETGVAVIHGNSTTTGTATTTVTVTIGSTLANNTYAVSITPRDLLTAVNYYISAQTTTTFDVTFVTALTGSINFDWILNP